LGTASSGIRARVSTSTAYYDAADRLTASVDLGSNGGTAYSRPATPPAASDTALVTLYGYDAAGRLRDVTDPMGRVQRSLYDALGRRTTSIATYTGGAPGSATDVTTRTTYNGNGQVVSIEAVQPAGTPAQITQYLYEARTATGSAINSNDLLTAVLYPDPLTGVASASQKDSYQLNALGDRLSGSDRNGTVHSYGYDVLGRRISDAVTTLGAGVDGAVRRIEVGYDGAGQAALTSSYDAASGGAVLNQVGRVFNGFGQLTIEWQSHLGAINLTTTPKVSYGYSLTSGGNHSRPTSLTHPDGYVVGYGYDSGLDATISRLSRLSNGATTLESYRYLGASEVVERARPEVGITLSMISQNGSTGDGGDQYTGLDRFGRLVDQRWFSDSGAGAVDVDRYGYTYDRNSNRLTRSNAIAAAFSETYTYDALNQLSSFSRSGGATTSQQWQFDALGNWTTVTTNGVAENRTANAQNELTQVGTSSLAYSPTGNLTIDAQGRTLRYDAWNRLVSVADTSGTEVARYGYDGLNRRIVEQVGTPASPAAATAAIRDVYYSQDWQALEERVRTTPSQVAATADTRFIWSPVYVDAMIARDRNADGNTTTGTGGLEQRVYAIQDANWNTTAIIAATGVPGFATSAVINRFAYTPYGESQTLTASWATPPAGSTPATPWAHLFQGLKFNDVTNLFHARNRDYSFALGRFIQLDPIGFSAGDNNWYRFVGNGPTGKTDPSGLCENYDDYISPRLGDVTTISVDRESPEVPGLIQVGRKNREYAAGYLWRYWRDKGEAYGFSDLTPDGTAIVQFPNAHVAVFAVPGDPLMGVLGPFPHDNQRAGEGTMPAWSRNIIGPFGVPIAASKAPKIARTEELPPRFVVSKETIGLLLESMRKAEELMRTQGRKNQQQDQVRTIKRLTEIANHFDWPTSCK
jgi:RHS repeat-associated protein